MTENNLKPFFSLGQLAGGVILGVALWLRHDSQTSNLLILQFEGNQAPGTFYISEYTPSTVEPHCVTIYDCTKCFPTQNYVKSALLVGH